MEISNVVYMYVGAYPPNCFEESIKRDGTSKAGGGGGGGGGGEGEGDSHKKRAGSSS